MNDKRFLPSSMPLVSNAFDTAIASFIKPWLANA